MPGQRAGAGFTSVDWIVVVGVLLFITVLGKTLAGRQGSMRDFFLGGRKLPWLAVSASIIATEISAVTYISLPSVVFKEGGDITYLQLGLIGSFLARAVVAYVLVPAYFEEEIYSPYDYMGARLGEGVRRMTTILFSLGGVLGQSARIYLTAVVLQVLLAPELAWFADNIGWDPLVTSVLGIGAVAIIWTWMGGIAAVVWTDVFLFLLFVLGIGVSLWVVHGGVSDGLGGALSDGLAAGKFKFLDTRWDPTRAYTIWVACIAAPWGNIGPYGTDQLITQRLLCCKQASDARRAMLWSSLSIVITFLVAVLGVGLWAFYREQPLAEGLAASVASQPDRVFPVFISTAIPTGLRGLVIAGAFAAAISSLDSILAALSQTSMSTFVLPLRRRTGVEPEARETLLLSRVCVLFWGGLLCAAAIGMRWIEDRYDSLLDLALAMAGYTGGALLAAFVLAFRNTRRGASGFVWSAPLSILAVFSIVWHAPWALRVSAVGMAMLGLAWMQLRVRPAWRDGRRRPALMLQSLALALGFGLVIALWRFATFEDGRVIAFPWYIPCGSLVAYFFALVLDRRSFTAEG